jgi:hypothetical protein
MAPGSDDPETAETIAEYQRLADALDTITTDSADSADSCPECERSHGPHYRGRCTHGGTR